MYINSGVTFKYKSVTYKDIKIDTLQNDFIKCRKGRN